jgi:hypothetical protein
MIDLVNFLFFLGVLSFGAGSLLIGGRDEYAGDS